MEDDKDLKEILEENLSVSYQNYRLLKKISRALFWSRFYGFLKFAFIIALLIMGLFYVKPWIEKFIPFYQGVSGNQNLNNINEILKNIDPKNLPNVLEFLKNLPKK